MRKIFILTLMSTLFFACGPKGVVSEASRALKSDDLKEARALIDQALEENEEAANDPQIWKVIGDIGDKAFENQRTQEMLGKEANQEVMYNGLMDSYAPYLKQTL